MGQHGLEAQGDRMTAWIVASVLSLALLWAAWDDKPFRFRILRRYCELRRAVTRRRDARDMGHKSLWEIANGRGKRERLGFGRAIRANNRGMQ